MSVHLTKEFLNDLRASQDARFVREVLNHTIAADGTFTADRNDHRYDGIQDGWIRYVSRGATAYRVIFIRRGPDVFLYRAGRHAVEDRLTPPPSLSASVQLAVAAFDGKPAPTNDMDECCLLKTTEATFLGRHIESLYHVRHKEIYLVSPYIDLELLSSQHSFGRFLDRALEEKTTVVLITSTDQEDSRLASFRSLEERGISVFFLPSLHTKLYVFEIDLSSRNAWQLGISSHAIVGSSNLTNPGIGFGDVGRNEELNCRLPATILEEVRIYVTRLMVVADDYTKYAFKTKGRRTR